MQKNYDDIIDLKRFEPKNHPRMPRIERAAQFAPFAALKNPNDKKSAQTSEEIDEKSAPND